MAKSGPKPRRLPNVKPSPRDGWEPPAHLSDSAKKAWVHVVGLVAAKGNLSRTDPTLVECYAVNVATLREAQEAIGKDGLFVSRGTGAKAPHPALALINSATMRLKAIINDLGLCPSSAKHTSSTTTTTLEQAKSEDKWADVLSVTG